VRVNLRHITKDVLRVLEQNAVTRIILAGPPEVTAELRTILPKRLRSKVIGEVDVPVVATIGEVQQAVAPVAQAFERDTEEKIVNDLITSAAKSSRAAIGMQRTLDALNEHRIWQLVYASGFHSAGYECSTCSALFSHQAPSCPFCDSALTPVPDIVERAIDHALHSGARVELIQGEKTTSSLMNAGGIGAFFRTRTAGAMA
jgi:peptide subunit release factor 1 (eRF1)